ncbi:MAG TPA: ABC transporter permease subunit [Gammaproteobacteria bacterium]|nr:ABC transporter permease subunit [Gammaproteobacteria bacterium]
MMTFKIAWRELRNLFLSPLAWCVLAVVQFILAWMFLASVEGFRGTTSGVAGVTDVVGAGLFSISSIVLLLVVPLLSMRLVAEERRSGSLALLLAAPVRMTEIVLGKYLGLFGFLAIMVGFITLMPLSLALGTHLDYGKLAADVLGLLLLVGAFAAAGLYMSTLTRQPVVAAVSSFGLLLFLWIINWLSQGDARYSAVLHYLSLVDHYSTLLRGSFDSSDVVYYLLFILTFLVLSIRRLDGHRLQH